MEQGIFGTSGSRLGLVSDTGVGGAITCDDSSTPEGDTGAEGARDDLLECLVMVSRLVGFPRTAGALRSGLPLSDGRLTPDLLVRAAEQNGYGAKLVERKLDAIDPLVLPVILLLKQGQACVLCSRGEDGSFELLSPATGYQVQRVDAADLASRYAGHSLLMKPPQRQDRRAGEGHPPAAGHWFWGTLWRFRRYYLETAMGAILVNILTLAGSLFTMNVYDRVVPNQAYSTLWVLAVGTALAAIFEFVARSLRVYFVDVAGKKADLLLGAALFRQAMARRLELRPASSGAFANLLREFETVRDFATSATLTAITDLPFVLLFLAMIALVGGPLVWVPAASIPLVLVVGLLVQIPLSRIMHEHLVESSRKHGILVEAVEGLEALKASGAEGCMQGHWEDACAASAQSAMKSRFLSGLAINWVVLIQQIETIVMVVWGVYLIHAGQLSMGALIACVILGSRALSPLGQVVGLAVRYQAARAALESLDKLMQAPVERDPSRTYLSRSRLDGAMVCQDIGFAYPGSKVQVLAGVSLRIEPGERVGILGAVGSGKSTLLRIMAGLYQPLQGQILVDEVDLQQIDPADVHRNLGYVAQESTLFYGTLRDNILLGQPLTSDERLLAVTRLTGLDKVAARHPLGLDLPVGEGGAGLSGGQKQLVALARCLVGEPPVLLMDEPTSAMDGNTETAFIAGLRPLLAGRTLVLATHRPALLELVDRLVVVDGGRVVADGPKVEVLQALTRGTSKSLGAKG